MADDTWATVALPILRWIAQAEGPQPITVGQLADDLELDAMIIANELDRLVDGGYLFGQVVKTQTGGDPRPWFLARRQLGPSGARAVGLWPSGDAGEVLLNVLRALEESTPDPEQKTRLRGAVEALGGMARDLLVDVAASFAKKMAGLD